MTSDEKNVTDYLKVSRKKEKRTYAVAKTLQGSFERLQRKYGLWGPTYKKDNGIEIGFASQKNHICFYCLIHQVMLDNKELLKELNHGSGGNSLFKPRQN